MIQPHDDRAERTVLGAILLNADVVPLVSAILEPDDFYTSRHAVIFEAACGLWEDKAPVDAVSIMAWLRSHGKDYLIHDITIFSSLVDEVSTTASVEYHAQGVQGLAQRRKMIMACQETIEQGTANREHSTRFLQDARERILSIEERKATDLTHVRDLVGPIIGELGEGRDVAGLIPTGLSAIDLKSGGLWPGLLTVVAGRPSMGKSVFALNIATNAAFRNKKVLLFTLEDTAKFVLYRICARLANVDSERIMQQRLRDDEMAEINNRLDIVRSLPLYINDEPSMTADEIRRISVAAKQREGVDLIVIDHLGHVRDKTRELHAEATWAARKIAELPKLLNCPVLLVSQLNRQNLQRSDPRPTLGDIRQTGELEQLARVVWLLHRPGYYDDEKNPADLEVIIAKASHGPTGSVWLEADLPHMFIQDLNERFSEPEQKPFVPQPTIWY